MNDRQTKNYTRKPSMLLLVACCVVLCVIRGRRSYARGVSLHTQRCNPLLWICVFTHLSFHKFASRPIFQGRVATLAIIAWALVMRVELKTTHFLTHRPFHKNENNVFDTPHTHLRKSSSILNRRLYYLRNHNYNKVKTRGSKKSK